ncbi:hypothetical protein JTB14_003900 [Gonioctena quinquepunctata]|nr:hypothetical protein JTB14_003900 [Gonioctena quinquepunctata]
MKENELDTSLLVRTENGYIQGRTNYTYTGKQYWTYQGIPYAKPPLGNLRFRAPEPFKAWQGVLDATQEGLACIETYPDETGVVTRGYEDCLYINVYTPKNPQYIKEHLPVLVWIYGGAFIHGNSSANFYGADNLLAQDIIVVTFNYRLGLFGFLSTEDMASPGNYGLKDQNLALSWVQQNIRNFGGDKNRVTISGQSAGAASVFYQMAYAKSKGLFRSVISSSGSPLCHWAFQEDPRKVAFDVGLAVGVNVKNSRDLIEKLRRVDAGRLKEASKLITLLFVPVAEKEGFPFSPTIEPYHKGAFLTQSVYSLLENGNFYKVPILMGHNSLESLLFAEVINLLRPLNLIYDISPGSLPYSSINIKTSDERSEAGKEIMKHYFRGKSYLDASRKDILNYYSDVQFIRPLRKTVQLTAKYTPIYYYLFSYMSDYGLSGLKDILNTRPVEGVSHLEEQWYIWKRKDMLPPTGLDKLISQRMVRMWTNFIRTGNPTPKQDDLLQRIIWPTVSSTKNITLLEIGSELSLRQHFRQNHMEFWDEIYNRYGHPPYITY